MNKIFNSLNFRIFCAGAGGGLVLLGLSAAVGYNTFGGALLLNLAASALTVALTAITVDLIIKRTNAARTKGVAQLAGLARERVEILLLWGCGRLYGFKVPGGVSAMDDDLRQKIDAYLAAHINDPHAQLTESEMTVFTDSLKEATEKLDAMAQLYAFALSPEVLNTALILRELIARTIEITATYTGEERIAKLRQGVPLVLDKYAQLRTITP